MTITPQQAAAELQRRDALSKITPAMAAAELLRRDDAATAWGKLSGDERREAAMELMLKDHISEADRDLLRFYFVAQLESIKKHADQMGDRRGSKRATKALAAIAQ